VTASDGLYTASVDGAGSIFVARLALALPPDRAGIIVERPVAAPATDATTALGRRSVSVVSAESRLEWFEISRAELVPGDHRDPARVHDHVGGDRGAADTDHVGDRHVAADP
jgi:hypothetical protein